MLYHIYELQHATISPLRMIASVGRQALTNPFNPAAHTHPGRLIAAAFDLFEHATERYGKPAFGLDHTLIDGTPVAVSEQVVMRESFAQLKRFARAVDRPHDPKVLLVAPMSGHFATLLRGTVQALLPDHDLYITDWEDARHVPVQHGHFDLDSYVDYIMRFLRRLGPNTHVVAVCQPSVPVLAASALMAEAGDPARPASLTLMGGPIDTRVNPTEVNRFADKRPLSWFERQLISRVPLPHAGVMRRVYPGFLQLAGFMSMNWDRHLAAHREMFLHLVDGDGESAEAKRAFYKEYLAVMDLPAEFFLQTVHTVFHEHHLPEGKMTWQGLPVDPGAIEDIALFTVEGERDDITGVGQTRAAHRLCSSLPDSHRAHYEQPGVGHYGVFNGRKFRDHICPRIKDFIARHDKDGKGRTDRQPVGAPQDTLQRAAQ